MSKHHRVGNALIPAIAYGDAAGLPFEGMKKPLVTHSVHRLHDTTSNPYIDQYPAGTWSDDTHLSVAVTEGLIDGNGYNLEAIAEAHIHSLEYINGKTKNHRWASPLLSLNGKNGWGKGTTGSVERLAKGASPFESGNPESSSNGVLMKIAPLIFWQSQQKSLQTHAREQQIIDLTRMTHASPEAITTSLLHGQVLTSLLDCFDDEAYDATDMYLSAVNSAKDLDQEFDREFRTSTVLSQLVPPITSGVLRRNNVLDAAASRGFRAPDTLVMAYGSFVLNSTAPESVYRAVEMGGDADSIGSIVNTMSLFASGKHDKPADYAKIYDIKRLETVSLMLTRLIG